MTGYLNKLIQDLTVKSGHKNKLADWDPDYTARFKGKDDVKSLVDKNLQQLAKLQYLLYAENKHAVLVVLQAMDAGGKDSTIRTVMSPLNPQSCKVTAFKTPSEDELAHDFLWRIHKFVPRMGEIRIFNRSHYEDVLIVRVDNLMPKSVWSKRFEQINNFEKMLVEDNIHVIKFFLHISKDEQLTRLKERLEDPTKQWKVNPGDFAERQHWDEYAHAYEDALNRCSTNYAPWYVIPANKKWFRNLAISLIMVEVLSGLKMKFPKPHCDISSLRVK
jgi:PPK2 family polyphosphate:nucleotide phosphotransferase